jgi:hypothetical protein
MSKKIEGLEAGKTYRLIDKEGYFDSHSTNLDMYNTYFIDGCVTLDELDVFGDGCKKRTFEGGSKKIRCVIEKDTELQFFELVCVYWDGEAQLEVGMVVQDSSAPLGHERSVKFIKGVDVVLEDEGGLYVTCLDYLGTLVPDPKEEFAKKMLEKVRNSHPDFAHETTFDIEDLSKMCYDELKGGGDE